VKQQDSQERHETLLNLCVKHLSYRHPSTGELRFGCFKDLEEANELYEHYLKMEVTKIEEAEEGVVIKKIEKMV
jgi:SOS response regulatory protein OraA/RecX